MTKNAAVPTQDLDIDFDLSDDFETMYEDDLVGEMMASLVEANHHQMSIALELTKLIAEKDKSADVSEEGLVGIFIRTSKTITENSPIKTLLEKMEG